MSTFGSIQEVLRFAINSEQEAVDFYTALAKSCQNAAMQEVFTSFAHEEMKHKKKLLDFSINGTQNWQLEKITDLKVADYTPHITINTETMTYQEALVVAMHKEKAAFRLYTHLAQATNAPETKELFSLLAMEESKHKLRFEIEYDDRLAEN